MPFLERLVTLTSKLIPHAILALWLPFIAFLMPPSTCQAAGPGPGDLSFLHVCFQMISAG